ncbi:hypothetical protein [Micromonospora costi]|uniref:Thioredoxin domain-containing protein n=1 Tax=Micromonospora costi TaxID=1530042 RepID=A0A3B0A0M3_9ACTN|nr:hypothetical protein [Micromonospora costi]RKN54105.1 hypothetical protein D7193_18940 [Micromonospora costi]
MTYVFGFALLVLAGAVVVLFAMLGQLSERSGVTPAQGSGVRLLEEARVGRAPDAWPAALAAFADGPLRIVLVLSTACNSCRTVAGQLAERTDVADVAVVVSTADAPVGAEFVAANGLTRLPHHVDESGAWVSSQFGISVSPAALVFRDGVLISALAFTDFTALRSTVSPTRQRV